MRLPTGWDYPVEEFDYEESAGEQDHSKYLWGEMQPTPSHTADGRVRTVWMVRHDWKKRGGRRDGRRSSRPDTFITDDGDIATKSPAEVSDPQTAREAELAKLRIPSAVLFQPTYARHGIACACLNEGTHSGTPKILR